MSYKDTGTPLSRHIGNRVLELRRHNKQTIRDVSAGTGLSNAFICQIEKGRTSLTVDTLLAFSQFFGVSPGSFFNGFK